MNARKTELHILLDASTSMTPIRKAALKGLNAFLEEQKQVPGTVRVSLHLFNHQSQTVWDRIPLEETAPLQPGDYPLSGGTALYDVMGRRICELRIQLDPDYKATDAKAVIFLVVTDGWDRHSAAFSMENVAGFVSMARKWGWTFLLLGAGEHLKPMALGLGIPPDHWLPCEHSPTGMRNSLIKTSRIVTTLRTRPRRPPPPEPNPPDPEGEP